MACGEVSTRSVDDESEQSVPRSVKRRKNPIDAK